MGLFDRFRKREVETNEAIENVDDVLLKAILKGEKITRDKALTLPAVSANVDLICNAVASMPVKLYKCTNGKVEEVEDDQRTKLLNCDTYDTLDPFQMKKALVEDYLLGKGGYCYIKHKLNDVVGLYYVEDSYISILKNSNPIYKSYNIYVNGERFEPFEFIKILRNTKDGASGTGITDEVSKALETAYATLKYQLGLVKSGGNKKGFITATKGRLTQEAINVLKKAWNNLYSNNSENVVILNDGLNFQEASNSSVEMQLNESKETLRNEINSIFHVHPDNFDLTFKEAIYPIVKAFETALNRDLLLEDEKDSLFFAFDVKEIVKANIKDRYDAYKTAKETGFITLNEIRKEENMNDIEGLDVINVGLSSVLYDTRTHTYYTPNTGQTEDITQAKGNQEMSNNPMNLDKESNENLDDDKDSNENLNKESEENESDN